MGIFQHTPLPPIVSSASTPPLPHDPIPAQGDQPPRRSIAAFMAAVVASWPLAVGPILDRPNQEQVKIAPLTLVYGAQPIPVGPVSVARYHQLSTSWPPDLDPTLKAPAYPTIKIAPLTLVYGAQPTPSGPVSVTEYVQLVAMWQVTWDAQTAPKNAAFNVPPILSVVPYRPLSAGILGSWEPPWVSPPRPVSIVTLSLPTGTAPVPSGPIAPVELYTIVSAWPMGVGPLLPYAPPRTAGVTSQPRADQPPIAGPMAPIEFWEVNAAWQVTWDAQTYSKNAGWNVPPILSAVVYAPLPRLIWTAWEPPFIAPPRPVSIVTLTLPTGQQPQPQSALAPYKLIRIAGMWTEVWDAQTAAPSAGWNVPPLVVRVPFSVLPRLIWTAWEPPFIAPPRPVIVAPLTLPTGVQPPPISPLALSKILLAVQLWEQKWGAQSAYPNAATNLPITRIDSVVRMTNDSVTFNTFSGDTVTVNIMTGDVVQDSD